MEIITIFNRRGGVDNCLVIGGNEPDVESMAGMMQEQGYKVYKKLLQNANDISYVYEKVTKSMAMMNQWSEKKKEDFKEWEKLEKQSQE